MPSTRTVGALIARCHSRSSAGVRPANIARRLPATVNSANRSGDLAIADGEARRTAAVVPGNPVDAHADQLGHVDAVGDVGDQLRPADRACGEVDVAGRDSRWAAGAARGVPGRRCIQLPRGGAVHQPAGDAATLHQIAPGGRQPLAIERTRAQPARTQRILGDDDPGREQLLVKAIEQEARAPGDRPAAHRADQVAAISPPDTRVSNTTGRGPLVSRPGFSRATARSPACRPISAAAGRSPRWRALRYS